MDHLGDGAHLSGILNLMLGGVTDRLQFLDTSVDAVLLGGPAVAGWRLHTDGNLYTRINAGGYVLFGPWIVPTFRAAAYECRWNAVTDPDVTPGSENLWIPLTSIRTWETTSGLNVQEIRTFDIEIGLLGTSTALIGPTTITLNADGNP